MNVLGLSKIWHTEKKKLWPFKYICHTFGLRVEENRQFKDRFGTDVIYDVTGKSGKSNDVT